VMNEPLATLGVPYTLNHICNARNATLHHAERDDYTISNICHPMKEPLANRIQGL